MEIDRDLIERCILRDEEAQEKVYRLLAPRMYGMCLRYAGSTLEACDFLQEGFLKVFREIGSYRHQGSFEGWVRRIIINTALNLARREIKYLHTDQSELAGIPQQNDVSALSHLSYQELLSLIQQLPAGYRTVFNLYVIEGYAHKEIAQLLNISENTSKSQLFGARKNLQRMLLEQGYRHG